MENIVIKLYSKGPHISQILTGFCMVERNSKTNKCRVKLESSDGNIQGEFVEVLYKGKRIIYDVLDGYQDKAAISALLKQCDFYFKRSYSPEKNRTGPEERNMLRRWRHPGISERKSFHRDLAKNGNVDTARAFRNRKESIHHGK